MGKPLTIADGNAFYDLPKLGKVVEYLDGGGTLGRVFRKDFDTIEIETKLGQITKRSGYERQLKITVPGFHRAHALGPIVGHESPHGIYFTPESVNLKIQAQDIESFVGAIGKNIRSGQNLYITVTVVRESISHKVGTEMMKVDFLKGITYTVHTEIGKTGTRIFEAGIEIVKPNDVKSIVNFTSPFISSEFNKYCDLDAVLSSTKSGGLAKTLVSKIAKVIVPLIKGAKSISSNRASTQNLPKATAISDSRNITNRFTGSSHRGLPGKLSSNAKNLAGKLNKFYTYAGKSVIKSLPTIFKLFNLYGSIQLLYSVLEDLNTALSVYAYGTPIPEFEKELKDLNSALHRANQAAASIYENNIMQENPTAIADELYNDGNKEALDEITNTLLIDYQLLLKFKRNLTENYSNVVQLQEDIQKSSDAHLESYKQFAIETASKATDLFMWDALRRNANGLTTIINETRDSIDSMESVVDEYNQLVDYFNDSSWSLQILRSHDMYGMEPPTDIIKPSGNEWGPDVR